MAADGQMYDAVRQHVEALASVLAMVTKPIVDCEIAAEVEARRQQADEAERDR